jgi:hypothetical protein
MSELVALRTFGYRHEAEVVRSVLEGHGIEAEVVSDDCGAFDPALGLVQGAHLMVYDDDAERADALLTSFDVPGKGAGIPDDPQAP